MIAEDGGFAQATSLLQQSLEGEQSMAQWIVESLPMITRRYAKLHTEGGSSGAKV